MAKKEAKGGFAQMPKMMTDEPSVILKLKKGGKVAFKKGGKVHHEEHEHKPMNHVGNAMYAEDGEAPKKPSMSERRKAMNPTLLKKGGKVAHKAIGGMIGAPVCGQMGAPAPTGVLRRPVAPQMGQPQMGQPQMAQPAMKKGGSTSAELRKVEKELKHHEHEKDSEHGGRAHLKHGGKVHHISGHEEGTHEHHKAMAKHHAKMHKEGGSAHHHKLAEHHKHEAKEHHEEHKEHHIRHHADGGAIDRYETRTTIEKKPKKFLETHVENADREDRHHGTKSISEKNAGGYKRGGKVHHEHFATGGSIPADSDKKLNKGRIFEKGTIEGNEHDFEDTEMHQADKDKAHGTKSIKEENAGGFKRGGRIHHHHANGGTIEGNEMKFAKNNVDGTPRGKSHGETGDVEERNAGGFKRGGHAAKKAYATGGSVNDIGRPVAYPKKPLSRPISNSLQSGTFKKGGRVKHPHFSEGGDVTPTNSPDFRLPETGAMKRLLGISETVAPKAKKK